MTWQITLNHVCSVLYDISLLAQAYRCMQMLCQTLLFKSAAWHGTFDMIISHLSDLTSPSSDRKCQRRWELMATLNMNLDKLQRNTGNQASDWKRCLTKAVCGGGLFLMISLWNVSNAAHTNSIAVTSAITKEESLDRGCSFHAAQLISNRSQSASLITAAQMALQSAPCKEWSIIITHNLLFNTCLLLQFFKLYTTVIHKSSSPSSTS